MAAVLELLQCLCAIILTTSLSKISADNLAFKRAITANTTCGSPPEFYYKTWQDEYRPIFRRPFVCNATSPNNSHHPGKMADGDLQTYWQSKADVDVVNITIDLRSPNQKFVFVKTINITFEAYQRPGQIFYSRSTDGGRTYSPWHYYVSFPYECRSVFGTTFVERPFSENTVLCRNYLQLLPSKGNESVFLDLYGGRSSSNSPALQQWMNATNIRLQFSGLFRKFDIFSAKWHHYAVRHINVAGFCFCNGHGSACTINTTSGSRSCKCSNNACGPLCDTCCPAFNQYPWRAGNMAPFEVDTKAACQPCNCHRHSNVCVYNETVANARLSLNSSGVYSGGGVCQSCTHNTTGINCERCITHFYRPVGKSRLDADVCKECNCSTLGSDNVTGVVYLDCVKDETVNISGKIAGDCFCKQNVHGRKCNSCKPGFYNLSRENMLGCQDCLCYTPGTINASNICDDGRIGSCPCKLNVEGRSCGLCKDQFFNLTSTNQNGCQGCVCDPGASSSLVCNKTSGQCLCKSTNMVGRRCEAAADGYYFPNLHYVNFAVISISQFAVKGSFQVPSFRNGSGVFYFIIKYRSTVAATGSSVILNRPTSTSGESGSVDFLSACTTSCYAYVNRNYTLLPAKWDFFINFLNVASGDISKIVIEDVIALPSEFYNADILGSTKNVFLNNCDVLRNNMSRNGRVEPICEAGVYTLTMHLLNEPIACDCNATGSLHNVCTKFDGQCSCKPGVTGKKCDRCLPRFYNFTNDGCTPCNCSNDVKECDKISGQCACPANTIGRTCNNCSINHWGWNSTTGCQVCSCNDTGSSNLQCNLKFGNCSCKYGIAGPKCTSCMDTFTGFSVSGCRPCNCSQNGSESSVCDKSTGQCPCKRNTVGQTCGQCNSRSFYLSSGHSQGCLSCICMGITTNCSSNNGYVNQASISTFGWRIGDETNHISVSVSNSSIGNGVQSIPAVSATIVNHSRPLFWIAPDSFTKRSLVNSYGGTFQFTLSYTTSSESSSINIQNCIIKSKNFVIYQNITRTSDTLINLRRIQIHERFWRFPNGSTVNRSLFLLIIAKPSAFLVGASSYFRSNNSYTTSIGGLSISTVSSNVTSYGRALQVEQCSCGPGYSGSSCERCAQGYKRSSGSKNPYLGTCRLCECNGHSTRCDPDTGKCSRCSHNTTGDFCEKCLPGFYGNATAGTTTDCKKCPCDSPRTLSSLCEQDHNGTIRCLNCSQGYEGETCDRCKLGFYGRPTEVGGSCQICNCNNNSDICNTTTGVCQNCQYNTSGSRCGRCKDGWFGDAINRTCQTCSCNITGSVSSVCNHTNGQCQCKDNVIGMACTTCKRNSFGFNNNGCKLCNCSLLGSLSLQCNESGICQCRNYTIGSKCDMCSLGHFGLPVLPCQACNCNATGSRNESCSSSVGQCFCNNGIIGRQCSSCAKQFINFTSIGCTACPPCSSLLQTKINTQIFKAQTTYANLESVEQLANLTSSLLAAEQRLNSTQASKEQFDSRISTLRAGINRIKSDSLSQSVNNLESKANELVSRSSRLINVSITEQDRNQVLKSRAEQTAANIISVNATSHLIEQELQRLQTSAQEVSAKVQSLNFNFTMQQELLLAQRNAADTQGTLLRVQTSVSTAKTQGRHAAVLNSNISQLLESEANENRSFLLLQDKIITQQSRLNSLVRNISDLQVMIRSTNESWTNTSIYFESIASHSSNTSIVLSDIQKVLQNATELINNATGLKSSLNQLANIVTGLQNNESNTRLIVNEASSNAANLTRDAENLTSVFAPAKLHGANAVNAVRRYQEVSRLINQSMELSAQANRSVQGILDHAQQPGNQNLTGRSSVSLMESRQVFTRSTLQSNSISDLRRNLTASNHSYEAVVVVGNSVSYQFNYFMALVARLTSNANYSALESSINKLNQQEHDIKQRADSTLADSRRLQSNLSTVASSLKLLNLSIANATELMINASSNVNNITRKLNDPSNSPINDVNNITRLIQTFNSSKSTIERRLSSIQSKLNNLKQKMARMQTAARLNGSNLAIYAPTVAATSPSAYSEIQIDFRTRQRNAHLLHVGNDSASSAADSLSLRIVDARVVFEYQLNGRKRSLTNWAVEVSDGYWRRVLATRQGDFSRITVSVVSSNYSRTYSLYNGSDSSSIRFEPNTRIFLGSTPLSNVGNSSDIAFDGCVNHVKVNKMPISLWNASSYAVSPGYCNATRSSTPAVSLITGASFAGNGFIQHSMGNFSIRNTSRVEFDFRTFQPNGTLFAVKGVKNTIVYSVFLLNGNLEVLTSSGRMRARANPQASGSYADGGIYRVSIIRSSSFTVSVVSVSTGNGPSPSVVNGSQSLLDEGVAIYFGGVNETHAGELNTGYRYSGCIMNVRLSRNGTTDQTDAIQLNDARLLRYSKGVRFDGCLAQIQNGARFLGNGYASATTPSQYLSTLRIVFKTFQPNGVLFFSIYKGAKFYIALYHGNIFLEYKNDSRNAKNNLYTRSQTLNRGQYNTLDIIFTGTTLMSLTINGEQMSAQLASGLAPSVQLNGRIYFGGVPPSLSTDVMEFPVSDGFKGDFRQILINNINFFNLLIIDSESVSLAGVSPVQEARPTPLPTTPPPTTLPPSCAASSAPPQLDGNPDLLGIGENATLALRPPPAEEQLILSYLRVNFLITVEFRSLSPFGVIFFVTNNNSASERQFVSLELVDGTLVYKFNSGGGLVQVRTTRSYASGIWTTVYLLRLGQFGAILVATTQEYHNNRHGNGLRQMDLVYPFYLGSFPNGVTTSMLTNPSGKNSFRGCIKKFQVQSASASKIFNLRTNQDSVASQNLRGCYQSVVPMIRMSGNGYLLAAQNLETTSTFSISMRFRTSQRNGILWHLRNDSSRSLVLEQRSGQIFLLLATPGFRRQITWTDPNIPANRAANMSYFLCDNIFHTISVVKSSNNFTITVDSNPPLSENIGTENIYGSLYVGGSPGIGRPGLNGCLQNLVVNNRINDLASAAGSPQARSVSVGCSTAS